MNMNFFRRVMLASLVAFIVIASLALRASSSAGL
jgi:hypothetical protein